MGSSTWAFKELIIGPPKFRQIENREIAISERKIIQFFFLGLTNMSVYPLQALDESDITKYKIF